MSRRIDPFYWGGFALGFLGVSLLLRRAAARPGAAGGASASPAAPSSSLPKMLSSAETDALFGPLPWKPVEGDDSAITLDPGWQSANLVQIEIPQLRGVKGAPASGRVTLHKAIADQVVRLFAAWEAAGLLPLIRSWDGSFASRRIRGRTTVSKHAYGIAFDINASWNRLGEEPAPVGAEGSVRELVDLAREHGFAWGGNYVGRKDGMHFEAFQKAS